MSGPQESQTNYSLAGQSLIDKLAQELMEGKSDPVRLPNNSTAVSAQPIPSLKKWHTNVTPDLRNDRVNKLLETIFPRPDPSTLLDECMQNLVAYAKKVEGDMYGAANSRVSIWNLQ